MWKLELTIFMMLWNISKLRFAIINVQFMSPYVVVFYDLFRASTFSNPISQKYRVHGARYLSLYN